MEIGKLENLQKLAAYHFGMYAAGGPFEFPNEVVRQLLGTEVYDGWSVGLYLLSILNQEQIAERYFDDQSTYRSISKYIASDLVDSEIRAKDESEFRDHSDAESFEAQWQGPSDLREFVAMEFNKIRSIAGLQGSTTAAQPVEHDGNMAIIIHGTWATSNAWWQPKTGDFWKHIKKNWAHLYDGPSPFWWSGANWNRSRLSAAKDLIKWTTLNRVKSLDIIAHSHGGNVCLLAAQLGLKINRLILLGTPIRTQYMLNLSKINSIKNVFSIWDLVQIPGSMPHMRGEGRTLSDSSKVVNFRAMKNHRNWNPSHTNLHEPATWQASKLDALL